jgi:hypothetical protein
LFEVQLDIEIGLFRDCDPSLGREGKTLLILIIRIAKVAGPVARKIDIIEFAVLNPRIII